MATSVVVIPTMPAPQPAAAVAVGIAPASQPAAPGFRALGDWLGSHLFASWLLATCALLILSDYYPGFAAGTAGSIFLIVFIRIVGGQL